MSTNNKENNSLLILAAVLVVFVVIGLILKKMFNVLNTESPVLDETSKKILKDKKLVEDYYQAIEKEKKGEDVDITVEGEKYKITRAGKYSQELVAS